MTKMFLIMLGVSLHCSNAGSLAFDYLFVILRHGLDEKPTLYL